MKSAARLALPLAATALVLAGCATDSGQRHAAASASVAVTTSAAPAVPSTTATPAAAPTPTASELLRRMTADVGSATSVHVKGDLTRGGTKIGLDLSLDTTGGAFGTVSMGGSPMTVLLADGKVYLRITDDFLRQHAPGGNADALRGKYVTMTDADSAAVSPLFHPETLVRQISASGLQVGGVERVDGQNAWTLTDSAGSKLYVAAQDKAFPLRITGSEPGQAARLDFTDWNAGLRLPAAPRADQVVDLGKLGSS